MKTPNCPDCPQISGVFACETTKAYATDVTITSPCARLAEQAKIELDLLFQIAKSPSEVYGSIQNMAGFGLNIRLG